MPDVGSWLDGISPSVLIAILVVTGVIALVTIIGAIALLVRVVRLRRHLGELPTGGKVAFWASLVYTILPFDLLPDPVYLDDMAVLGTTLVYLTRLWRKRHGGAPVPRGRAAPDAHPPVHVDRR